MRENFINLKVLSKPMYDNSSLCGSKIFTTNDNCKNTCNDNDNCSGYTFLTGDIYKDNMGECVTFTKSCDPDASISLNTKGCVPSQCLGCVDVNCQTLDKCRKKCGNCSDEIYNYAKKIHCAGDSLDLTKVSNYLKNWSSKLVKGKNNLKGLNITTFWNDREYSHMEGFPFDDTAAGFKNTEISNNISNILFDIFRNPSKTKLILDEMKKSTFIEDLKTVHKNLYKYMGDDKISPHPKYKEWHLDRVLLWAINEVNFKEKYPTLLEFTSSNKSYIGKDGVAQSDGTEGRKKRFVELFFDMINNQIRDKNLNPNLSDLNDCIVSKLETFYYLIKLLSKIFLGVNIQDVFDTNKKNIMNVFANFIVSFNYDIPANYIEDYSLEDSLDSEGITFVPRTKEQVIPSIVQAISSGGYPSYMNNIIGAFTSREMGNDAEYNFPGCPRKSS